MTLIDLFKFFLKLIISVYVSAAFGYIIMLATSTRKGAFFDALSPVKLFNEITSGNVTVTYTTIIGTILIMGFNYFRKTKVDWHRGSGGGGGIGGI